MRLLSMIVVSAMTLLMAGCSASSGNPAVSQSPLPPDPHTAAALLTIARSFNHDYDTGDYRPVYARWDARSQTIITRADYIKRHRDCPGGPQSLSQTESIGRGGPHRAWLVHY